MPHMHDEFTGMPEPKLEPIAVCGMACRLPGQVDSSSKLWQLLLEKKSVQTPKVPSSRFNIDAHYHPDLDRPGSFNALGGYFLDGPADQFDPTFFNMTPIEAMWMDPQQRRIMEVCYEAFESAGLSLEDVSGTNCAVYVATFTADYQQMSHRETDFRHNYVATGVDCGIMSNRVGNTFNLHGPSFTINTACSSSIYAVHNACNSLRAGDCDSAIVGGVNLVLTVDQHMNTAKLGILSPTSTCHTFDASADGYGRAEGAGALYLKRLSDAVRDGDVIRTVIRSTAVNTNGKVPGMGITHPSKKGQEMVIRKAYERAGLDPNDTAYFECHGTGTPVGDPIEVHAVSKAMNDTRTTEKPLILGAIKANIGHSEAASGVFAIMKAALMTENGMIPGTCGLKNLNPEIRESDWNVKISKDTKQWPTGFNAKRVSLSSFGYGGTNGHVIVESVQNLHPEYRHGKSKDLADYDHSATRPFLVLQSAHDRETLIKNIAAHQNVVENYYLADFAHTLSNKRSHFDTRGFTVAEHGTEALNMNPASFQIASARKTVPELAFLFTGQGAAWQGMAVEALQHFPVFADSIRRMDNVLRTLEHPADFSIYEELLAPAERSRINEPKCSQPILVAIEIALVDLLASWKISPKAVVGHSAGEYAAAYAAGLISAPETIIAAYYRGFCLAKFAPSGGSMLAVGAGVAEVSEMLKGISPSLVVACENSPASVTVSGPAEDIRIAKTWFDEQSIFARELTTGMAYHSPAMNSVAGPMVDYVTSAWQKLDHTYLSWRRPRTPMISSVDNACLKMGQITPSYWARNLTGRVLFSSAVTALLKREGQDQPNVFIELGPHSALAGPFKQIVEEAKAKNVAHIPTFVRKQNSAVRLLKTAGQLYVENYPVDFTRVNEVALPFSSKRRMAPLTLVDLPPYQWNYKQQYWAENRTSNQQRATTHARHDVLGRRIPGLTKSSYAWTNKLRCKDLPWLLDHQLGGDTIFPAAGHMAAAIEATHQMCELRGIPMQGVQLRDIVIGSALVIPNDEDGIQIQVRLTVSGTTASGMPSFQFILESLKGDDEKIHSTGSVTPLLEDSADGSYEDHPVDVSRLHKRQTGERWYDILRSVGFDYGPSFNDLHIVRSNGKSREAAASLHVRKTNPAMNDESRYVLHPSTVDACLQLIIISIHRGVAEDVPWGVVPVKIEQATYWPMDASDPDLGSAVAWTSEQDGRAFNTHTKLMSSTGKLVLDVSGLQCITYEAAIPFPKSASSELEPYSRTKWNVDIDANSFADVVSAADDKLIDCARIVSHKLSPSAVAFVGPVTEATTQKVTDAMAKSATLTFCHQDATNSANGADRSSSAPENSLLNSNGSQIEQQDLIVANLADEGSDFGELRDIISSAAKSLKPAGRLVASIPSQLLEFTDKTFSAASFKLSSVSEGTSTYIYAAPLANDHPAPVALTIGYLEETGPCNADLISELRDLGVTVDTRELSTCVASPADHMVIYDPTGAVLTALNENSWKALQDLLSSGKAVTWVTQGVQEQSCVDGGAVQGFLRVLRAEDPSAELDLLDVDTSSSTRSIASALQHMMRKRVAIRSSQDDILEAEMYLHDGKLLCPRIVSAEKVNKAMAKNDREVQTQTLSPELALQGSLSDAGMTFEAVNLGALSAGQVEVRVTHETNLKSNLLPKIAAGVVTALGEGTPAGALDQHVLIASDKSFATMMQVDWSACVSCHHGDAAELISQVSKAIPVVNALQHVSPDQQTLLLQVNAETHDKFTQVAQVMKLPLSVLQPDLSFAGLQAVLQIAASHGKVAVIAHDFDPYAREAWRSMPAGGSFIVNEGAVADGLDPLPLTRGVSLRSTSISNLWKTQPEDLSRLLRNTVEIVKGMSENYGTTAASKVNAERASTDATAIAQADVLTYNYGQDMVSIKSSPPQANFDPEACYLLVGCLGGLGRSLTSWMMDKGARNLAFISRSGTDKREASDLIEYLTANGINADVFRADASNVADVKNVVDTITKTRSIRGVVHAAMVLNDGVFGPNLSLKQFNSVMAPKVDGAKALVEALRGSKLDFFVATSSISATVGMPGQCAYAAANSFLDALAAKLRKDGVPAVSLALPMILGVGVVAESDTLEQQIRKRGMYGVEEDEMLRGFEASMCRVSEAEDLVSPPLLNMGLDPARLSSAIATTDVSNVYWWNDHRLSGLRTAIEKLGKENSASSQAGAKGSVVSQARTLDDEAALALVAQHIIEKCSTILMVPVERFEVDGPSVASYGLDSMIGTEMRSWLFKEFGLKIPFQELLSGSLTFLQLSRLALDALRA